MYNATRRNFLQHSALFWAGLSVPGLASAQSQSQSQADNGRITQLFNFGWKFAAGELPDAGAVAFDDSGWRKLDLPHDFQFEQPWDKSAGEARGFKAMGTGWYRKSFKADPAWKGKKVLLDFEGLMLYGDVWLNGRKLADIDYGYLGAEVDVSAALNYDGDNVVAVRASTGGSKQSRWYTGGGLFRDVHLVVKEPIAIARHGVFISTPVVSEQGAEVAIRIDLDGISNKQLDVLIRAVIFGPDGARIAETLTAAPKGIRLAVVNAPLQAMQVAAPKLWSCEAPNLYRAEITLIQDGKVLDQVNEQFGIRTVEFTKETGFHLNGRKVFLQGISNHHDLGALGAAVYDRAIERLFIQLKAFGFNHVRTSHNPYSKSFMRLADKHGILIVDELADKWSEDESWPGQQPFSRLWYKIVPDWIKRDRNHPSVIMWSLGNELQMREDFGGFPTSDWGVTTYKLLDTLVKRYDTTRKTTVAMFPSRANAAVRGTPEFNVLIPPELSLVTEVASYNYQFPSYQTYLQHAPHLIIYQSEAATSTLTGAYYGMDKAKMVGLAYWGAVEYWGESNGWPKKGWNFSFFSHALEPYPQAYLVKAAFSDEPLVRIGVVDGAGEMVEWNDVQVGKMSVSSHWNRPQGSQQALFTYTNADEVELLVNGKSLGRQPNPRGEPLRRNIIYWKGIAYGDGGSVTAVAYTGGREVARHELRTTGKAVALKLETETTQWRADGMDLQYLKIRLVDKSGQVVPLGEDELKLEVSGAARLLALDDGNHSTDALYTGTSIRMHNGFAMAILRSGREPGTVTVKVTAAGVKGGAVALKTVR
ncbi:glycoside hydrolase family 2 TIM barrel-domain containing protein [Duganella guangzhouensis]|uniref:glycoside hydrolase family 2 TIM barrel-domain containing protein n=1 Tax=Duganella guangzhouensis TaxID=2666084 RepID=UPI00353130F3